jgi:hypothetical protein
MILSLVIGGLVSEVVPSDSVFFGAVSLLLFFNIITISQSLAGFSNSGIATYFALPRANSSLVSRLTITRACAHRVYDYSVAILFVLAEGIYNGGGLDWLMR